MTLRSVARPFLLTLTGLVLLGLGVVPVAAQDNRADEGFQIALGLIKRGMHDDAARQLRRFLRDHPNHRRAVEAWYRLGTCYLEVKKPDEAARAFRSALSAPGSFELRAECRYRLGHALKGLDKLDGARAQFRSLVDEEGRDHYLAVPAMYAEGECLRDLDREDEALARFREAAGAETDGSGRFGMPALYQAGFLLFRSKRYEEAMNTFSEAAKRYPKHPANGESRFLEGESAFRAKNLRRAERAYGKAVQSGGEFADDGLMGIAWCKLESGNSDEALTKFRDVASKFPKSKLAPKALLEAGKILYKGGRYEETLTQLKQLLRVKGLPKDVQARAHELRGLSFLELGRTSESVDSFRKALAQTDDVAAQARLLHGVGEAYAEKGNWKEALASYEQSAMRAQDVSLRGDAVYGQILALHRLGRFDESIAKAGDLVRRDPSHRLATTARFAIAENLFALKKYEQANAAYARVPKDHDLARKAQFKRAWCSYLQGHYSDAADRFEDMANSGKRSDPIAEESLSMAALAWLEAGKGDEAIEVADRYRARYPSGKYLARTERVAARVLKGRGDLRGAASRLAKAASVATSAERSGLDRLEVADVLFQQGNYAEAKQRYRELATQKDRVGARAQEGMAWCAFELAEDEECETWVRSALKHPEAKDRRAAMYELLAALHHRGSRWDEAEKVARRFLAEFGKHERAPEMRYTLGVAQARAGKLEDSRRTLEGLVGARAVKRPDRVYYELAWVCRKLRDEPAALHSFEKVAEISEDEDLAGEANLHIGEALIADKKRNEGRARLKKVRGKYRRRALYRIGFSWLDEKKPKEAFAAFDSVVQLGSEGELYEESLFLAGESLYLAQDHGGAAQRYRLFLQRSPDHDHAQLARLHLGECEYVLSKPQRAISVLEEFLRRKGDGNGELAVANLWLGKARQKRGEHARAEQAFKRATELSESEVAAEAQFRIGQCRSSRGDHDGAVDAFVKLSILYGHEAWVQRGLLAAGDSYAKLKQPSKARKFYKELIEKFPGSPAAEEAKARLKNLRRL